MTESISSCNTHLLIVGFSFVLVMLAGLNSSTRADVLFVGIFDNDVSIEASSHQVPTRPSKSQARTSTVMAAKVSIHKPEIQQDSGSSKEDEHFMSTPTLEELPEIWHVADNARRDLSSSHVVEQERQGKGSAGNHTANRYPYLPSASFASVPSGGACDLKQCAVIQNCGVGAAGVSEALMEATCSPAIPSVKHALTVCCGDSTKFGDLGTNCKPCFTENMVTRLKAGGYVVTQAAVAKWQEKNQGGIVNEIEVGNVA
eukprot:gnl/MRDRNA2_/MRDRNA2_140949_c0_seq1.p1 gnl/MRDRNA2_/MRDRNA2_140949_c0~~gnl/MRDRNA2_/MRDRNA2_140949_c0_seq1.p1  ORF type:complete len:258 (-),score=46.58 gnl/MRDRNA2_/MRDRNA2_140949_c0_seq1:97-870(-)